jgi:hypothetical protein
MSFDLIIPPKFESAYALGELTLMSTKAGLSSTLVDSSHNFVSHAGYVESSGINAVVDTLAVGGSGAARADPRGLLLVAMSGVVAGIALGAGAEYLRHRRKQVRAATENSQSRDETVLVGAEAVVDAKLARRSRATSLPCPVAPSKERYEFSR